MNKILFNLEGYDITTRYGFVNRVRGEDKETLVFDMAGVPKENIFLTVQEDDYLFVKAQYKDYFGVEQTISCSAIVDTSMFDIEKATARYSDGTLYVSVPQKEKKIKSIAIN